MPTQITINSLTGTSPYDIYICDYLLTTCFYIDTISSTPYYFNVPPPLEGDSSFKLKVVDNNNCEIIKPLSFI
jgi:hypothetical protein